VAASRYLPPEHGAWAMLLVPFLLGTFAAAPTSLSALLLVSWLAAYLTNYFTLHWWRARHRSHRGVRFRTPAVVYATVLAVSGAVLVLEQPWLLLAALLFVPFEALAAWYALRGEERSWVAGVASATAASLMAPVSYRVADGGDESLAAALFAICWLAFVGTVLHVKSTIRERANPRFRAISIAFHVVALGCAVRIDPWLAIPFGFLMIRSVAVPQQGWRPARIGAVEIVGSTLVLVVPLALVA
jgi:YwiC-like protein